MIRNEGPYFEELCDKYEKDFENINSIYSKLNGLKDYIREYTSYGDVPKISWNSFEKYLFASPEILINMCKPDSQEQKMFSRYREKLPELVQEYGAEIFKKMYFQRQYDFDKSPKNIDTQLFEDYKAVIDSDEYFRIPFETVKKIYDNCPQGILDEASKNLTEKYPSELVKLCYNDGKSKFEIGYSQKNEVLARIMNNIDCEDYKTLWNKEQQGFLSIMDVVRDYPQVSVNKIIPLLNDINPFYSDLYNKILSDNPDIKTQEEKEKVVRDGFLEWRKQKGQGFPRISSMQELYNYRYINKERIKDYYDFTNKRVKAILEYYDDEIIDLLEKYGVDAFKIAYGFGHYVNEGELNLNPKENKVNLEEKLIKDYKRITSGELNVAREGLSFESFAKIIKNAPEEYIGKQLKHMLEAYPEELLKKMYSGGFKTFYLKADNKDLAEIVQNMDYRDIMPALERVGGWYSGDARAVLKTVFNDEQLQKVDEFYKEYKLQPRDLLVFLYDVNNTDRIIESLKKHQYKIPGWHGQIGVEANSLQLAIFSNAENVYEYADELYNLYGEHIAKIDISKVLKYENDIDDATLKNQIEELIANAIKSRKIIEYGENLPQSFKEKYPNLFLGENIPDEIKEKFYKRQLQYSDFVQNGQFNEELWNNLKNQHLYIGTKENINFLEDIYNKEQNLEPLNQKTLEVLRRFEDLEKNQMTNETKKIFKDWISKNIVDPEMSFDEFSKKVRNVYALVDHIILSNSSELRRFQDKILDELLNTEKPMQTLNKIEQSFLTKEKSVDERLYSCFKYLHPDFLRFCNSATSPVIRKYVNEKDEENIKNLIKTDLLKSIMGSNNRSFREYLKQENISEELIKNLKKIGIDSPAQALQYMDEAVKNADRRNRERAENGKKIQAKQGDFIKGLTDKGIIYAEGILQNGSLCKEFLGHAATTDGTPLDTDVSIVGATGIKGTYSYGSIWGPIYILLKNDERFVDYKDNKARPSEIPEELIQNNKDKMEVCYNSGDTAGIRTGFASTEIDAFIVHEGKYDRRLEVEIVKNGFYIPITDVDGKVLFTPKQYDLLREKMAGLKQYGTENDYKVDSKLVSDEIRELAEQVDNVHDENEKMKNKIYESFKRAIDKYNSNLEEGEEPIVLKDYMSDKIVENELEILSTGSSERDTNVPGGKLDFDFIIRLDNKMLKSSKWQAIREKITKNMCEELHISYKSGDIKDVEAEVEGEKVKLDLSFIGKTDKIEYSTEMCLKEKLAQIKSQDPEKYKYVVANIMLAKKMLSDTEPEKDAYKKRLGGLGGVGIENWILQNGGSFYKAAKDFTEKADKCGGDYEKFKKEYAIWDFGKNHYANKDDKTYYPHDDFVYANLKDPKFKLMTSKLKEYLKTHEFTDYEETNREQLISFSEIKSIAREPEVADEIGSTRPVETIKKLERTQEKARPELVAEK